MDRLLLVARDADGSLRAFLGADELALRRVAAALLLEWREAGLWMRPDATGFGSDAGHRLRIVPARALEGTGAALVLLDPDGEPERAYLVRDQPSAWQLGDRLDAGRRSRVAAVERGDGYPDFQGEIAAMSIRLAPAAGRRCPRCEDALLSVDPVLDARDARGERICSACGVLEDLRRLHPR